ncbi:MAG: right-handed parallel beta-helix repeat-containing protein [Anaerolineae bacterium]|nr:right-handed parallel beta-helix repeat-containing protein [Anaerolineae bacterium]
MITQAGGLSSSKEVVRLRRLVLPFILALGFQIMLIGLLGQPVRGDAPQIPASSIRCVNPGGTGGCYASIQAAINAASYGDVINVAAGVYHERITMKNGVSIHGQGWLSTTLHGDYSAAQPTVNIPAGVSASTVLSGVQVTGGGNGATTTGLGGGIAIQYASPSIVNTSVYSCTAKRGGGVLVFGGAPSFSNVLIWNNRALYGGGLYLDSAMVNMTGDFVDFNGTIWFNSATAEGGGIYMLRVTSTLTGLRVWWNTAGYGGGVYIEDTHRATLTLNDISSNSALHGGGGLHVHDPGELEITGNLIRENTATYDGGGVRFGEAAGLFQWNIVNGNRAGVGGGGVSVVSASPGLTLGGNWFEANLAGHGGGLCLQTGAAPRVDGNTIVSNTASLGGGFFLDQAGPAMIVNNIVARNVATAPLASGGIQISESPVRIINNTLAENKNDGVWFNTAEGVVIANNIIYGHTGDGIENWNNDTASYTADYNDLFGNGRAYVGLTAGVHDRALNPQFVAAGPDLGAYYHIQATSPVSAAGSIAWAPPLDIDGDTRIFGGSVSMGADELPVPVFRLYLPLIWRKS